ncbi:MAG: helix-turn-helix domain-containing protein [Actinobacteria bacterium]|nr:helix-turn-helix domain-containing protein [Actinomycetota bacterium]
MVASRAGEIDRSFPSSSTGSPAGVLAVRRVDAGLSGPALGGGDREEDAVGSARLTVSVPEVAVLLGVSRSAAYMLVRSGEIPGVRLGRRVVVPLSAVLDMAGLDVDDWLRLSAAPPPAGAMGLAGGS